MKQLPLKHNPDMIKKAAQYCGSIHKLALAINVNRVTVSKWIAGDNPPSAESCMKIERATNGHVRRWHIREDIMW